MDTTTLLAAPLDLTAAPDAPVSILRLFDALEPGERLVADVPRAVAPLALAALQAGRKGLFEWSILAEGETLRVELLRRSVPEGELRGVTEALGWDHDRLEEIEAAAFAARAAGDFEKAVQLYGAFATGLRRHIRFEEELLFPVFERKLGFPPQAGPTAVMRYEHREIEALIAQIGAEIGLADSGAEGTRARLHAVLGDHNMKEERILYPHTDGALGPEEADALVCDIQAF